MVTKIRSLTLETTSRAAARRAMHAACAPFGSLSAEIADLALAYLSGSDGSGHGADAMPRHGGCTVDAGIALLRATRADCPTELHTALTAHGEWSEVLLGGGRVQLITPGSGTVIELRATGRRWILSVDFGEGGSEHRAHQILERDTADPTLDWRPTPVDTLARTVDDIATLAERDCLAGLGGDPAGSLRLIAAQVRDRSDVIGERDPLRPCAECGQTHYGHAATCSQYLADPDDGATIAQPDPAQDGESMTVGTGEAKAMPAGVAEELAAMSPGDRGRG